MAEGNMQTTHGHEEIFETSDLPESDQADISQERFESEHIETVHLDVGAAFQRFKGKQLSSEDIDFSDALIRKRRKGYGVGGYVLELMQSGCDGEEGVMEKYHRLHHEINELEKQIMDTKDKENSKSAGEGEKVSGDDIAGLHQSLKQLQVEQILGEKLSHSITHPQDIISQQLASAIGGAKSGKKDKKDGETVYELLVHPEQSPSSNASKIGNVESRLAKLETLIGSDADKIMDVKGGGDGKRGGLVDAIENLSQKVDMLDPQQVEMMDARLGILIQKLNQIAEKKQKLTSEEAAKVNDLYELMKKWESFTSSLPSLLARLQSVSDLHEQALQFSQSLTQLDGAQQQLSKTLEADSTLLQEIKSSLEQNLNAVKTNCEDIEKRLKAVGK